MSRCKENGLLQNGFSNLKPHKNMRFPEMSDFTASDEDTRRLRENGRHYKECRRVRTGDEKFR